MNPIAAAKCYLSFDRSKLCGEGDPEARILFANKGEQVSASRLAGISNASDFFADESPAAKIKTPEEHLDRKRKTRG